VLRYRVHDTTGDNLGLVEHPAPNLRPGDVVQLPDGREALVVAKVETGEAPIATLLEVVPGDSVVDRDLDVERTSRPRSAMTPA